MGAETAVSAASTAGNAIGATTSAATGSGISKWIAAAQGASSLMSVFSGLSGMRATASEAELEQAQGALLAQEAQYDAIQKARDVKRFREAQASGYNASGVTLEGTPLLVLEETRRLGQEEVDAILRRGTAAQYLYNKKATQTKRSGRMALLGSFAGAATGGLNTYLVGRQYGLFGNKTAPSSSISGLKGDFGNGTGGMA